MNDNYGYKILSGEMLLTEARELMARSRVTLAEMPENTPNTTNTKRKKTKMEIEVITPARAAELYTSGMSVVEVARATGITYAKARKLIADSGTSVRDSSSRLKGRTRTKASAE